MINTWKRWTSIVLLALLCMGAFAQSTSKNQERINEFTAIEGFSALKYNYFREKNLVARPYQTNDKPLIRLVAINKYAHWNFKPAARVIWDFFRHFSRDMETKKLM